MKLVSVRALMMLLMLTLVVVSSAICLALSISAAEEAIKKTEDSGNSGIRDAFTIAEVNVKALASDLMSSILTTSVTFINDFVDTQRRLLGSQRDFFTVLADTPVMIGSQTLPGLYDYSALLAAQVKIRHEASNSMATGMLSVTGRGQFVAMVKGVPMDGSDPNFWNNWYLAQNNGTDRASPFANTIAGLVDSCAKYINTWWNCSGVSIVNGPPVAGSACVEDEKSDMNFDPTICSIPVQTLFTATQPEEVGGKIRMANCYLKLLSTFKPLDQSWVQLGMTAFDEGSTGWSPIVNIQQYVGTLILAPISSKLVQPRPVIG